MRRLLRKPAAVPCVCGIAKIAAVPWLMSARRTYYDLVADLVSEQKFPRFDRTLFSVFHSTN